MIMIITVGLSYNPIFTECGIADIVDTFDDHTEKSKVLTASNGELFPWDDVR